MSKKLVTHINPHLDDIAAIWLFKKFHPEFVGAEITFISASVTGATLDGKPVDSDQDIMHFGVGRGKYDEHKGDISECATSLVWNELKQQGMAPKDEIELAAYDELVEWNRLIDTATLPQMPYEVFTVPAFIRPLSGDHKDSLEATLMGERILDAILQVLLSRHTVKKAWADRIEFQTKWGRAAAIQSDKASRSIIRGIAHDLGQEYGIFLMIRPKGRSVEYFSDKEGIDLTDLDQKIRQADPEASWYLHHGKRMLLCGAKAAPGGVPSKLSLEELIEIAKSV